VAGRARSGDKVKAPAAHPKALVHDERAERAVLAELLESGTLGVDRDAVAAALPDAKNKLSAKRLIVINDEDATERGLVRAMLSSG
jgi:hypothetical protein